MSRFFKIKIIGNIMILERITSPRIRFFIRMDRILPEIIMISVLEECNPEEIGRNIRKINYFLTHYIPDKKK